MVNCEEVLIQLNCIGIVAVLNHCKQPLHRYKFKLVQQERYVAVYAYFSALQIAPKDCHVRILVSLEFENRENISMD